MSFDLYDSAYRGHFTVMGGIDVQTTIGFGNLDRVIDEVGALIDRYRDGRLILCTTHFIQDHCGIDELVGAFEFIYEKVRQTRA
ncbi:MAG: hypothetical protein EA426_18525 [Spirochaetaceae bacterium]|nr:MAG: hypothetical protein EA426_18525 [Spirochaetaceae bacterium]